MLYNLVHTALLLADVDLSMGVFHDTSRKSHALSLDFIEPFHPWMDEVVMKICRKRMIELAHTRPHKGGLWLNKAGRRVVMDAVWESWEETIVWHQHKMNRKQQVCIVFKSQCLLGK